MRVVDIHILIIMKLIGQFTIKEHKLIYNEVLPKLTIGDALVPNVIVKIRSITI